MSKRVAELVDQITPILADNPPDEVGAVLADLLAMWLAGHHVAGNVAATRKARAELLSMHCSLVRALVEVNARAHGTTPSVVAGDAN